MCQGSAPLDPANHYISDSKTQAPTLARPEQFPIYLPLWKNSKADSTREPTARRRAQVRPRLRPPRGPPPRPGHGFCLPSSPHRRPRRPCSPVPGGAPGWELRAEEASRERRAHGPWAGPVTTQQLPRPRHPRPSSRMGASRPRSRPTVAERGPPPSQNSGASASGPDPTRALPAALRAAPTLARQGWNLSLPVAAEAPSDLYSPCDIPPCVFGQLGPTA